MNTQTCRGVAGQISRTPTHTLIRVRNNQRRHRQRRREYIAELEQKLVAAEEKAKQLRIENDALRSKLSSTDSTEGEFESAVSLINLSHRQDESMANPMLPRGYSQMSDSILPGTELQPNIALRELWNEPDKDTGIHVGTFSTFPQASFTPTVPDSISPSADLDQSPAYTEYSACCSTLPSLQFIPSLNRLNRSCFGDQSPLYSVAAYVPPSPTTLCSYAYVLIQQLNYRGVPMEMMECWLWPGYTTGEDAAENGCRVDSQLLRDLLEYIADGSVVGS